LQLQGPGNVLSELSMHAPSCHAHAPLGRHYRDPWNTDLPAKWPIPHTNPTGPPFHSCTDLASAQARDFFAHPESVWSGQRGWHSPESRWCGEGPRRPPFLGRFWCVEKGGRLVHIRDDPRSPSRLPGCLERSTQATENIRTFATLTPTIWPSLEAVPMGRQRGVLLRFSKCEVGCKSWGGLLQSIYMKKGD